MQEIECVGCVYLSLCAGSVSVLRRQNRVAKLTVELHSGAQQLAAACDVEQRPQLVQIVLRAERFTVKQMSIDVQ